MTIMYVLYNKQLIRGRFLSCGHGWYCLGFKNKEKRNFRARDLYYRDGVSLIGKERAFGIKIICGTKIFFYQKGILFADTPGTVTRNIFGYIYTIPVDKQKEINSALDAMEIETAAKLLMDI